MRVPRHGLDWGTCCDGGGRKDSRWVGRRNTMVGMKTEENWTRRLPFNCSHNYKQNPPQHPTAVGLFLRRYTGEMGDA